MFAFLAPYKLLIEVLVIGAIISAIASGAHLFLNYERDVGYQKAVGEYTARQLEAEKAARAREQQLTQQITEAQHAAQQRDQTIKSLSTTAAAAAGSLRDAIARTTSHSLPGAATAAGGGSVGQLGDLLGDCADRYRAVAESAERERNAKQTLIEAWPK